MADSTPRRVLLTITVFDNGDSVIAEADSGKMPAYVRRTAIAAAVACLQDLETEMNAEVAERNHDARRQRR